MTKQQSLAATIQETLRGPVPPKTKLKEAVAEVLAKPYCTITNDQIDVKWTTFKTALKEPGSIHQNPLCLGMDVSRAGLVQIIEKLINTAHEKGSLTAEQMVTVIDDMKTNRAMYGNRGTYQATPEWEIKNKKLMPDKLLCPFCRHTMQNHKTIGEPTDLNRNVACVDCDCNDDLHPALLNLKDKSEINV